MIRQRPMCDVVELSADAVRVQIGLEAVDLQTQVVLSGLQLQLEEARFVQQQMPRRPNWYVMGVQSRVASVQIFVLQIWDIENYTEARRDKTPTLAFVSSFVSGRFSFSF